jgi:hypothetical protein
LQTSQVLTHLLLFLSCLRTYRNPHNPGQRLRVKVPKDCFPGGTFKVSVPVKQPPADEEDDSKDHNKFPREFQELVEEYARAYDDWCSAQNEVEDKYALYKEKQKKFDALTEMFPKSLLTPVDANYMKKIVRRARQNKHKRSKTLAAKGSDEKASSEPEDNDDDDDDEEEEEEEEEKPKQPKSRKVDIPTKGTEFPTLKLNVADFAL